MAGTLRKPAFVLVASFLVLSAPIAGVAGATPGALFGIQSVDPDQVLLRVDVQADGDAQWRVEYRVRLDTENESAAFEDLQAAVEENESAYLSPFSDRIRGTVDAAENATGREMTAENFDVRTRVTQLPQEYGVLTYTFTWTNFAVVDGERLRAGDALAGFFLDEETTLAISWPADHQAASVSPDPSERQTDAVLWRGPLDFADGEPRVVIEPEPAGTTGDGTTDGGGDGTTAPGADDDGLGLGTLVGVLIGVLVVGGAGFLYLRRDRGTAEGAAPIEATADADDGVAGAETPTAPQSAADDGEAAPPDALLSNEERVVRFLEERGGRAKQQEIVDGLDWTDAKTSQVLSGMASDDQIEKFRIGRENVVKLPDDEDAAGDEP